MSADKFWIYDDGKSKIKAQKLIKKYSYLVLLGCYVFEIKDKANELENFAAQCTIYLFKDKNNKTGVNFYFSTSPFTPGEKIDNILMSIKTTCIEKRIIIKQVMAPLMKATNINFWIFENPNKMELLEFSENVFTVFNSLAPFSENVKKQFFEFCSLKNLKKLAEIFSQKEHPPQAEKKSHKSSVEEIPLLSLNSKLPSRENGYKELSQGEREWKEEENRCCRIL